MSKNKHERVHLIVEGFYDSDGDFCIIEPDEEYCHDPGGLYLDINTLLDAEAILTPLSPQSSDFNHGDLVTIDHDAEAIGEDGEPYLLLEGRPSLRPLVGQVLLVRQGFSVREDVIVSPVTDLATAFTVMPSSLIRLSVVKESSDG